MSSSPPDVTQLGLPVVYPPGCRGFAPDWEGGVQVEELYDNRDSRCNVAGNFDLCEDVNVAGESGLQETKVVLRAQLEAHVRQHNRAHWEAVRAGERGEKDRTE